METSLINEQWSSLERCVIHVGGSDRSTPHAMRPKSGHTAVLAGGTCRVCKIVLTRSTVLTLKALSALSETANKTHPRARIHLGCLGLSDEKRRMQLQYSPFNQEQSFILGTGALKRGSFTIVLGDI